MPQLIKVADKKSLESRNAIMVEAGGQKIAIFKVGNDYYAIGDTCTHRGGPLSEGDVEGTTVTCPWHGAQFDVTSGKVLEPPAQMNVPSYKVVVEGEDIKIELP
ncbi:MAG: non-heme iron oxygenase ferredoxin subunit [Ignavibacteriae bacterium]|nr:non-heme iron oxygenase ferredoxin subunit [Ignavibacteriota bacterium]